MVANPGALIRLAAPADADAIHQLIVALAKVTNDENRVLSTPDNILRFGFGDESLFDVLLAEKDGRTVGLCLYFFSYSSWLGEPGVYVQDIYVADEERGTGLGRRLLHETAKRGLRRQATHLRLSVDHENSAAQRFYERLGMHHRKDEATYHIGGTEFLAIAKDRE